MTLVAIDPTRMPAGIGGILGRRANPFGFPMPGMPGQPPVYGTPPYMGEGSPMSEVMATTVNASPATAPVTPAPAAETTTETPAAAPQQRRGILGFLGSDDGRAALFRAGASMLSNGNIGAGLMAGAETIDQRKHERTAAEQAARDYGLRERGVVSQERKADADIRLGNRRADTDDFQATSTRDYQRGSLANQRHDTDVGSADRRYGYGVQERGQIRESADRRYAVGVESGDRRYVADRSYDGRQYTADARYPDGTPTGGGRQTSPSQTRGVLDMVLPSVARGVQGFDDPQHVAQAIQANPQLFGELSDAATAGYQQGGTSGAIQAAQGVLGRYAYSPFHADGWGPDGGERPSAFQPRQQQPQGPPQGQAQPTRGPTPAAGGQHETKVINGHTYQKVNGQWFDVGTAGA